MMMGCAIINPPSQATQCDRHVFVELLCSESDRTFRTGHTHTQTDTRQKGHRNRSGFVRESVSRPGACVHWELGGNRCGCGGGGKTCVERRRATFTFRFCCLADCRLSKDTQRRYQRAPLVVCLTRGWCCAFDIYVRFERGF